MNEQLQAFARTELRKGLAELTETHHRKFMLMYAPYTTGETVKERLERYSIDEVIDGIEDDKLDHAMDVVQRAVDVLAT